MRTLNRNYESEHELMGAVAKLNRRPNYFWGGSIPESDLDGPENGAHRHRLAAFGPAGPGG